MTNDRKVPRLLNRVRLAEYLGLSDRTLKEWVARDKDFPKPIKAANSRVWYVPEVDAYLQQETRKAG